MFATPDWRCWVASSRIPIVSVIPGRKRDERGERDDVGRRVEAELDERDRAELAVIPASGATIGSPPAMPAVRGARHADEEADDAARDASRQPPPSTGVSAQPARE